MGYRTEYTLDVIKGPKGLINELRKISDNASCSIDCEGITLCETKWYNHEIDLREFSKLSPEVVFKLEGLGEDRSDSWVKYFKNGLVQESIAKVTYDEYDENKLIPIDENA